VNHWRQEQRGIRRTARDHYVGSAGQRGRHRFRAKIGIGRDQPVAKLLDAAVELENRKIARLASIQNVVADDGRDLQRRESERSRDFGGLLRRGFRVGRTHIGDDLDALGRAERQHRTHPLFQERIKAGFRVLHARLLRQRHRALAQAFEHEVIDVALLGELERRFDTIARITGP